MPKLVDHEARRRLVADVAARLVAEGGIDAVTVRDVAAAAGTSTAIVSHYFGDKRELLLFTFADAAGRARARIAAVLEGDPADVAGVCEALLPLDDDRRRDWQVWLGFWGRAVTDPALSGEQQARVRATRATIAASLRRAKPTMRRDRAENEARRLLTVVTGLAVQAVFDPDDWPPARQRHLLRTELNR